MQNIYNNGRQLKLDFHWVVIKIKKKLVHCAQKGNDTPEKGRPRKKMERLRKRKEVDVDEKQQV